MEDKTWSNFKDHFRIVQKNMRRTGVLSINEAMNQDDMVNMISQNVINNMQAVLAQEDVDLPNLTEHPEEDKENTNPVILHLADKVDQLSQQLVLLQQQKQQSFMPPNQPPFGFHGWQQVPYPQYCLPTGQAQPSVPPMMPPTQPKKKWKFFGRYCWSCGACDHWGNKCQNKKPGHINKATFRDKKGGSTENCRVN